MTTEPIDAKPTLHNGIDFRSSLEANWAATLDRWAIRWEYEPERITLPSGAVYIPDFWLPDLSTWLEVKGTGIPRIEKAIELGETRSDELVIIGHPPKDYAPRRGPRGARPVWTAVGSTAWLGRCRSCRRMGWWTRRACRACGGTESGATYHSGSGALEFASDAGVPSRNLSAEARAVLAAIADGRRPGLPRRAR
jgi:hypothetical protein